MGTWDLPKGYELVWDADAPTLRRADGSMVAAFSAQGMDPKEVVRAAAEDAGGGEAPPRMTGRKRRPLRRHRVSR